MVQVGEGAAVSGPSSGGEPGDDGEGALLRITDVRGLYRPGYNDGAVPRPIGAGDCPGYVSHDDLGRVYINHRPRRSPSESWDVRMRDTQYIELTATVLPSGGEVPANAKIRWTFTDADDPSDAIMHTAAARFIDPDREQGGDNRGSCDHPQPDSGPPAYEAIDAYGLSNEQNRSCETDVIDNRSRVRLHLTNTGGDNFRVRAELVDVPEAAHETGLMTMWKRLDVAYYKMRVEVPDLPTLAVAREFEICFVQLDFTQPRPIDYQATLANNEDYNIAAAQLMEREFVERRRPGWYCLFAADLETSALSDDPSRTVYEGEARIEHGPDSGGKMREWLTVPATQLDFLYRTNVGMARCARITDGTGRPLLFGFVSGVAPRYDWPQDDVISFALLGLGYSPDFVAGDGEYWNVYPPTQRMWVFPTRTRDGSGQWSAGGLGFGTTVEAELLAGTNIGASGISPLTQANNGNYFAGRTMVFTGRFRMRHDTPPRSMPFDRDNCARTIVHEFTHAFGMPHACGYHSYDDPPDARCAMSISSRWLWQPGTRQLQRNHPGRMVPHLCARHILAIRETHLEDNPGLWDW